MRSKVTSALAAFLMGIAAFAQTPSVRWTAAAEEAGDGLYRVTLTGRIADGMHIYGTEDEYNPTAVEWAEGTAADLQAFIDENGPAVDAWLAQAGEEVKQAWNTLVNAEQHTAEEIQKARS